MPNVALVQKFIATFHQEISIKNFYFFFVQLQLFEIYWHISFPNQLIFRHILSFFYHVFLFYYFIFGDILSWSNSQFHPTTLRDRKSFNLLEIKTIISIHKFVEIPGKMSKVATERVRSWKWCHLQIYDMKWIKGGNGRCVLSTMSLWVCSKNFFDIIESSLPTTIKYIARTMDEKIWHSAKMAENYLFAILLENAETYRPKQCNLF